MLDNFLWTTKLLILKLKNKSNLKNKNNKAHSQYQNPYKHQSQVVWHKV
jgi:hypothetical protein